MALLRSSSATPHPISLLRRQAQTSGQGMILLEACRTLAPRVLPYSRRAARLLERIGLERPGLKLSGLIAELSAAGHKGIPAILVDKLADALGEMLAGRPPRKHPPLAPPLARLVAGLNDLERRTRVEAGGAQVEARVCVARLTLDENPPAFFYAEGRGFESVPNGLAVPLTFSSGASVVGSGNAQLAFIPVRGPMLDVPSRLYAIERIRDVVLEPIADEEARLASMLATGAVVRLALLHGGGLRITLRDRTLADELGLSDVGEEQEPGRWLVLNAPRAKDIVAALAARDDITLAWSSAERWETRRASIAQLKVKLGEKRDWLGMEGGVALDEHTALGLNELLTALREGRRYVVVDNASAGRGRTMVALEDALVEALEPLAASSGTLVAPSLLGLINAGALVEGGSEGGAWSSLHADLARSRVVDGEPSSALRAQLRPYQKEGLRFLRRLAAWGTGGVLADDMGLGKTVQAIAFLLDRASQGPALVIAPTSVCFNWRDELSRFAPFSSPDAHTADVSGTSTGARGLRIIRYEGPRRAALLADLGPGDVVVASYALVQRDETVTLTGAITEEALPAKVKDSALAKVRWSTLVLDEAQQVKNASTRRAKAVRALDAGFRIALTGTPLENHTGELWAIFDAVAPGLFGSWTEFKARFASPIEKDADARRRRTLAKAIAPFVLRRKKADVAPELPPRTEVVRRLPLEVSERRAYERVRQALLLDLAREDHDAGPELGPAQKRVKVLAAITRLRLVACHESYADDVVLPPEQVPPGSKQRALVELLVSLRESGHKALVFSQFVRHLEIARAAATAAGVTSLQLDGSTPGADRQALVERFQSGEVDAFFLSLKAGGTGLNLVRASYVIHMDPWWNPAVEDQASDRAHRIGQTQPVTVTRLVAEDTLEEQMLELHEQKRALIEGVLEGTAAAASLDVDELLALVRHTRRSARDEDLVQEHADVDADAG